MQQTGDTPEDSIAYIKQCVTRDLSSLLETTVQVELLTDDRVLKTQHQCPKRYVYETLETLPQALDLDVSTYTETPELLEYLSEADEPVKKYFHTSLLKSNCRVTSQPDWGDCFIYIKSYKRVHRMSLLKYLISFRDECHFHEEICETVYKRLNDIYEPEELSVMCLYARRGGIDINPIRASRKKLLKRNLTDITLPHIKTPKQ